jgi:hypothetical protein
MRLRAEPFSVQLTDNVVSLHGEAVDPPSYVNQVAAGFEQMYHFLWSREAELLAPDGPLRNWGMLRFVFPGTAVYSSITRWFGPAISWVKKNGSTLPGVLLKSWTPPTSPRIGIST